MKIALPSVNNQIDSHFGHCQYFTIFTIENKQIISEERLESPTGCGCKSNIAAILAQLGVKVLLAGNMGEGAVNVLSSQGIRVIRGCIGSTKKVVEDYLAGKIVDSGVGCNSHEGCHH